MALLIPDPADSAELIAQRRESGGDRYDEVWDGMYIVVPMFDNEHQQIIGELGFAMDRLMPEGRSGTLLLGANVSDRGDDWEQNYRCPDVVVVLEAGVATDRDTHYQGGPDLVVEVVCRHDWTRRKFDFYAEVGVREFLIVDRYPWALELYRLNDQRSFDLVGRSTLDRPEVLISRVLPLSLQLEPGEDRPRIRLTQADSVPP